MVSNSVVSLNDEPAEDDEAGDNEVEEKSRVREKLVLGYQDLGPAFD
jgi:hypothetical protein